MPDLTELKRLAEGATPGWVLELPPAGEWSSRTAYVRAERWGVIARINLDPSLPHWDGPQRANAAYIAAMNPDTAKKLIAVALAADVMLDYLPKIAGDRWPEVLGGYIATLRTAMEELKGWPR